MKKKYNEIYGDVSKMSDEEIDKNGLNEEVQAIVDEEERIADEEAGVEYDEDGVMIMEF